MLTRLLMILGPVWVFAFWHVPVLQTASVDLQVSQHLSTATPLDAGSLITFTVVITQQGPDLLTEQITFEASPPDQLTLTRYQFNPADIVSGTSQPNVWTISSLVINQRLLITITGQLTSTLACDTDVIQQVTATTTGEQTPDDNTATSRFTVRGTEACVYLPQLLRQPTPVPTLANPETPTPTPTPLILYQETFNGLSGDDDRNGWVGGRTDGTCRSVFRDDQYQVEVDRPDNTCFRPAPAEAERNEGTFEVRAYFRDANTEGGDFSYGIYINADATYDDYYIFRIFPSTILDCDDGGDWQIIRRRDEFSEVVEKGECVSSINPGRGIENTNELRIRHANNQISVFVNGTLLATYADSNDLDANGTGLFVRSDSEDIVVRFDDFTVYPTNQP